MGSVEQLPSGRYRAFAWNAVAQKKDLVRNTAPGSRGTWESLEAADAAWRARERELDGVYVDAGVPVQRRSQRHQFAEFAWKYYDSVWGEESTRRRERWAIRRLCAEFGDRYVEEITELEIRSSFAGLQRSGLAASTCNALLTALRQIMRAADKENLCDGDPTSDIVIETIRYRAPNITDQQVLLALVFLPRWAWPAVLLAYDCGLRAGEIAGLRWYNVDLDARTIVVEEMMTEQGVLRGYPKNKHAAVIVMTRRTAEALRALRKDCPAGDMDHVIRNRFGRPTTPGYISELWRKAKDAAGLEGRRVRFHDLRHACANNRRRAGVPATVIQATLRHKDLRTTQRYLADMEVDELLAWTDRIETSSAGVTESAGACGCHRMTAA